MTTARIHTAHTLFRILTAAQESNPARKACTVMAIVFATLAFTIFGKGALPIMALYAILFPITLRAFRLA